MYIYICVYINIYLLGSSARFARAGLMESYYRIILRDYITELYFGIILRDNSTESYDKVILWDDYGIIALDYITG